MKGHTETNRHVHQRPKTSLQTTPTKPSEAFLRKNLPPQVTLHRTDFDSELKYPKYE